MASSLSAHCGARQWGCTSLFSYVLLCVSNSPQSPCRLASFACAGFVGTLPVSQICMCRFCGDNTKLTAFSMLSWELWLCVVSQALAPGLVILTSLLCMTVPSLVWEGYPARGLWLPSIWLLILLVAVYTQDGSRSSGHHQPSWLDHPSLCFHHASH